jgi:hypothetical protein
MRPDPSPLVWRAINHMGRAQERPEHVLRGPAAGLTTFDGMHSTYPVLDLGGAYAGKFDRGRGGSSQLGG